MTVSVLILVAIVACVFLGIGVLLGVKIAEAPELQDFTQMDGGL